MMKIITIAMIAMAAGAHAADAQKTDLKMQPINAETALQKFDDICVANYLQRSTVLEKLSKDSVKWTAHKKRRRDDLGGGVYFESSVGEIGHVIQPILPPTANDPGCHFTFVKDQSVSHKSLVAAATDRFALQNGRDDSSRGDGGQMRWDFQKVGPAPARIFVTSDIKANGRTVSRLSISRHRDLKGAK
jgi:hypothetical protein